VNQTIKVNQAIKAIKGSKQSSDQSESSNQSNQGIVVTFSLIPRPLGGEESGDEVR